MWTVELRTQTLTASTTSYTLDTDLVDVLEAVITKASDSTTDIEIDRVSRAEYLNIITEVSNRNTCAILFAKRYFCSYIVFISYTRCGRQVFKYYGLTKIQDAGDYNDQLEVPTRFIPCLTSGLAYYVSIKKHQRELHY